MTTYQYKDVPFASLLGKTLVKIDRKGDEELWFHTTEETFRMSHWQSCCETVEISEVIGELDDLVGDPILLAEDVSEEGESEWGTATWTFYKLSTIKGSVTIRWHGESNGYYSESVEFEQQSESPSTN